ARVRTSWCQRASSCQPIGTRLLNRNTHPMLRPGTDNAELFHAELERGAVHSQTGRRTVWSREYPSGLFQCRQDMRAFSVFQSSVFCTNLARCVAAIKVCERNL